MRKSSETVRRSETHSFALPNIKKTTQRYKIHSSRMSMQRPSSFVAKMKQVTPDLQYQYSENSIINQEQRKLKKLLRQFNHDTLQILSSRIHKMQQTTDKQQRVGVQSVIEVRSREIENNSNIISLCQKQMATLEHKCENLKYLSVQEFQKKIVEVQKQIQQCKNSNKQLIRQNTLRGLKIVKSNNGVGELRQLEHDKLVLQSKKVKLHQQQESLEKESTAMQEREAKQTQQFEQMNTLFQIASKQEGQRQQNLKKKEEIAEKEKLHKQNQQKKIMSDQKNQHIYLKTLRDLQQTVKANRKTEQDTTVLDHHLSIFQKQIQTLQSQLISKKTQNLEQSIILKGHK